MSDFIEFDGDAYRKSLIEHVCLGYKEDGQNRNITIYYNGTQERYEYAGREKSVRRLVKQLTGHRSADSKLKKRLVDAGLAKWEINASNGKPKFVLKCEA